MQSEQNQNYWQPANTDDIDENQQMPEAHEQVHLDAPIQWQASEFVHHEKSVVWFLALAGIAAILLVIDFFLVKSPTFALLIVVMAVSAAVIARRPPRTVNYAVTDQGIRIDDKLFSFHDFRAFGVVQENAFHSIRLVPNKRFMPMVSVYFPPELGEEIVDVFGSALPMEPIELDVIDKFVEKIRF